MDSKFDMEKLKEKYARYEENAYNLMDNSPSESDYYAHQAEKILIKILLLESYTNQHQMRFVA
ncbi:MAG: hypothetical protein V7767_01305 [Leeuwenhoekiella sp.]